MLNSFPFGTLDLARWTQFSFILLLFWSPIAHSLENEMSGRERAEFLNAIRPKVEKLAGQAVRFKVDKLNVDGDWVALSGGLVNTRGGELDWAKAYDCDPNLDKSLWVVAKKNKVSGNTASWQIKDVYICSPEPPYWYLEPKVAFHRPCKLYAGLDDGEEKTINQRCEEYQRKHKIKLK